MSFVFMTCYGQQVVTSYCPICKNTSRHATPPWPCPKALCMRDFKNLMVEGPDLGSYSIGGVVKILGSKTSTTAIVGGVSYSTDANIIDFKKIHDNWILATVKYPKEFENIKFRYMEKYGIWM